MQILGLSESTPRTESRLKSLFWPSITSGSDVDYLGRQGYWLCSIIAAVSLCVSGTSSLVVGIIVFLLFYLGGVGVRQRSVYAATIVFAMFLLDTIPVLAHSPSPGAIVLRVVFLALLFSNARATFIASRWKPGSDESILPPRFSATWTDKFADKLPATIWPKVRYPYYVFSAAFFLLTLLVLIRFTK